MTRQTDELDRLIDQLNAGATAPLNESDDPELAALMGAVLRLRQLRDVVSPEPDWPNRTVATLARDLRSGEPPAEPGAAAREPAHARDGGESEQFGPASVRTAPEPPKRRTISRELAQMAAAIVVLVLVGGVLALMFRGQGGGNQGGIAAEGTPSAVAGAHLPLTVTANGVAVELESVDSSSTATRFSFVLRLSPEQLAAHGGFCCALGPDPSTYLSIEGITPGPNDPYGSESEGGSNQGIIRFTLQYQSPFPTDKPVTLTIKRLGLPPPSGTPTVGQEAPNARQIEGPWTFRVTPEMVDSQPQPTPFATVGRFSGVSVAAAQKWTSFPIVVPTPLPAVLSQGQAGQRNEFNVIGFGLGLPPSAPANYVMITYAQPIGDGVYLMETTDAASAPSINGDKVTVPLPMAPSGTAQPLTIDPKTLSKPMMDGVLVTRFETVPTDTNNRTIYYVWNLNDVHCWLRYVAQTLPPDLNGVTDADLSSMALSIIEQRGGDTRPATATSALPQPTATASLPLTVSANGVPVTLESITMADSGTSFEFQVRLPDAMAGTTFPAPVLILANDAQLVHGADSAKPQVTLTPHEPGNPDVGFSFAFAPIGKSDDPITLTIDRIRVTVVLPGDPSSSQQILQGPWIFQITPEILVGPSG